ncbi:MAG: non-heme iron oxygenase ferredoxin subunit [Calditrichaeota bacterium]|nr:non-heme iron oxygenase ferredoxin subunit [Calditrichota bacterium]MCB9367864.1 non-heme iron oxygenase ferredoxin subunit [Calditrichota bacterium]
MDQETKSIKICSVSDIPKNSGKGFEVGKLELAIFQSDGKWYATSDLCSHEDEYLTDGWLEGDCIECPRHGARFSLKTGEALSLPATEPIETFTVEIKGDDVYVSVPAKYLQAEGA